MSDRTPSQHRLDVDLVRAAATGNLKALLACIAAGAGLDTRPSGDASGSVNALGIAVDNGHLECAVELLVAGARTDLARPELVGTATSYTPPDITMIRFCVAAGADQAGACRSRKIVRSELQGSRARACLLLGNAQLAHWLLTQEGVAPELVHEAVSRHRTGSPARSVMLSWLAKHAALAALDEVAATDGLIQSTSPRTR